MIIGTKKALAIAIRNNKPQMRYTLLKQRLETGVGSKKDLENSKKVLE